MPEPNIPERTLSKRIRQYESRIDYLNAQIEKKRKTLRPKGSFDAYFWKSNAEIAQLLASQIRLRRKISLAEFISDGGEECDWKSSEECNNMLIEEDAIEKQRELFNQQAERLTASSIDSEMSLRRSFIQLFTISELGLGNLGTGAGQLGSRRQSKFRKALIEYYGSADSNRPKSGLMWCPIIGKWFIGYHTSAGHIFGYMNGQECMTAIFGPTEEAELWSARNGLLTSTAAEVKFGKGLYVIVPDVSEETPPAEISLWNSSEPKDYKIRIIDKTHPEIDEVIDKEKGHTWRDLDGRKVKFRNHNRPRARYLYYHYCTQLLRRAWNMKVQGDILTDELNTHFWGIPGKYIRQNMLRAFVEELGHDYEKLLEGAFKDSEDDPQDDPTLLSAAINQIRHSVQEHTDEDSEDDDDDELRRD